MFEATAQRFSFLLILLKLSRIFDTNDIGRRAFGDLNGSPKANLCASSTISSEGVCHFQSAVSYN